MKYKQTKHKYKRARNPPNGFPVASDEVAFEEKDNKKTIEMKKVDPNDLKTNNVKGKEEGSSAGTTIVLGLGFIGLAAFVLWAVSRRNPMAPMYGGAVGFPQQLQQTPFTIGGLRVNPFNPTPLDSPAAPMWARSTRQQHEVPDGHNSTPQTPATTTPHSNTTPSTTGSTPSTQQSSNSPDKVSIVTVFDSEDSTRGENITNIISNWLGSHSIQGSQMIIARSNNRTELRNDITNVYRDWDSSCTRTRFLIGDVVGTGDARRIDFYYVDANHLTLQGPSSVTIGNRTDFQDVINVYFADLIRNRIIPGR